jgi:hypothetical protein
VPQQQADTDTMPPCERDGCTRQASRDHNLCNICTESDQIQAGQIEYWPCLRPRECLDLDEPVRNSVERIRCFLCQGYRITWGGPVQRVVVEQQPPDVDDDDVGNNNFAPDFDAVNDPPPPLNDDDVGDDDVDVDVVPNDHANGGGVDVGGGGFHHPPPHHGNDNNAMLQLQARILEMEAIIQDQLATNATLVATNATLMAANTTLVTTNGALVATNSTLVANLLGPPRHYNHYVSNIFMCV